METESFRVGKAGAPGCFTGAWDALRAVTHSRNADSRSSLTAGDEEIENTGMQYKNEKIGRKPAVTLLLSNICK